MDPISDSLIDWSRAQFALTAMYHWIFVPLTLGLGFIVAIMETKFVLNGSEYWKGLTKFWAKLFGVNFAIGVATGIILEFEFGTNWSNYSWFVGDIFGAPLAIEGILAFFMETTFLAVMFFGWEKVSRRAHLASTWLTITGASISAWWILCANAWMQHPVGMEFNPDTVRNEMVDFFAVAFNAGAVHKFLHVLTGSWLLGSAFVVGVCAWLIMRKRSVDEATDSLRTAACVGLIAAVAAAVTGHISGEDVAEHQPMKLAAMEALADGGTNQPLTVAGIVSPATDWASAENRDVALPMELPNGLSILATRSASGYVPGINDILRGGYTLPNGRTALSAEEKMARGRSAVSALATYRRAKAAGDETTMAAARRELAENYDCFGYGYIRDKAELVPNVPLLFYSFRVMVGVGCFFLVLFTALLFFSKPLLRRKLVQLGLIACIPLGYLGSEAGWIVAEVGRQPWAIQDVLPNCAAVSRLSSGSVQLTFFLFLALFTALLIAEIGIMLKAISQGIRA